MQLCKLQGDTPFCLHVHLFIFKFCFFRAMGVTVIGTAGTKDGMEVVLKCGAHHVFNHNHKSYEKKMVEMLGGEGFDVIIEHLGMRITELGLVPQTYS